MLGPVQFTVSTNDLEEEVVYTFICFADDTKPGSADDGLKVKATFTGT